MTVSLTEASPQTVHWWRLMFSGCWLKNKVSGEKQSEMAKDVDIMIVFILDS